MTAHPDSEGMLKGAESAADGYLPKPFSLPTLINAVESRLGRESQARRRADEAKDQMHRILEASPDLIGILDPLTLRFHSLNAAGRELIGLRSHQDATDLPLQCVTATEMWSKTEKAVAQAIRHGLWAGENLLATDSGDRIPVKRSIQAHHDRSGKVAFLSAIAHDLTSQKGVETALRASEAKFRSLVHSLPDTVILHERGGDILFCNTRAGQIFECSVQDLCKSELNSLFLCGETGQEVGSERTCVRRKGTEFPAHVFTNDFALDRKEIQLTIIRDVSAEKELQRERDLIEVQLRQALKLESIGQLAAGIAHEINTPTQYIGDDVRFLQEAFAELCRLVPDYQRLAAAVRSETTPLELTARIQAAEEQADIHYTMAEIPLAIKQSLDGVHRVSTIVRAMKDFSHPGGQKELTNINHAIESTVTVARNEWKYVAELKTDFDPDLPAVPCIPGEFNQVILNLIINAAHAISDVTEEGTKGKGQIIIKTSRTSDSAEIRVSDTGGGIPERIQSRIFEPFFTTKEVGRGTGQGLAIARSVIVEKQLGTINFESVVGRGTTFTIVLPLSDSGNGQS